MSWFSRMKTIACSAVLLAALLLPASAHAEEPLVIQSVDLDFYPSITMRLVLPSDLLPDEQGGSQPVFTVVENGVTLQDVEGRSEAQVRAPVDIILAIDVSGSMSGQPLADAKNAARRFVEPMGPEDKVALLVFSSEPRVVTGFTSNASEILAGVDGLQATGETALYDAIVRSLDLMEESTADDRYIVVLSDGGDTTSINSLSTASSAVSSSGVPMYAVALESPEYDPESLRILAEGSAGRIVSVTESGAFADALFDIAQELRNIYSVEFVSQKPTTADLDIEITATQGNLRSSVRTVVPNPMMLSTSEETESENTGQIPFLVLATANPFWLLFSTLMTFASGALLVYVLGSVLIRPMTTLDQVDLYVAGGSARRSKRDGLRPTSSLARSRVAEAVSAFAERRGFSGALRFRLARAGLPLRPNEYIFLHLLTVVISAVAVQIIAGALATLVVVILVTVLPIAILDHLVRRRGRLFEEQLPDILSLVAGSLRSGWGLQQSIDLVVQEVRDPAASEFRRVQSETRLGLSLEEALERMSERLDSEDFKWVVAAIAIQRDVGGNLAEVLDIVAATVRERAELRREVRALTAESRFSALVLTILPFFMLVALFLVSPTYMNPMLQTRAGLTVLGFGAVLLAVGYLWLVRLSKLEV